MKRIFLTSILLITLALSLYAPIASSAPEKKVCEGTNIICDAADTCNLWYRDFWEDVDDKAAFEDEVSQDGNSIVASSCMWREGLVTPDDSIVYVREDEM